jgi:hypothetical protein
LAVDEGVNTEGYTAVIWPANVGRAIQVKTLAKGCTHQTAPSSMAMILAMIFERIESASRQVGIEVGAE